MQETTLVGRHIRLEPMDRTHISSLVAASAGDSLLYRWTVVPQTTEDATQYVDTALAWKKAGTAVPFVIVRASDGQVIGSTRLWNIEHWAWPESHPRHGRSLPDACEIGHSWLAPAAIRTAANTESKLMLLTHAFETWGVLRVCFHTDARNERSRAAIERVGGKFEGILRAHRMAADYTVRDSARYSILADDWPGVKENLLERLGD